MSLVPQCSRADVVLNNIANTFDTSGIQNTVGQNTLDAQAFVTGSNPAGYFFNSITMAMGTALGTPEQPISVSIFNSSGEDLPGTMIANGLLSGPASPASAGNATYTSLANVTLQPDTTYWIVANSAATGGEYVWNYTDDTSFNSSDGFTIPGIGGDTSLTWAISTDGGDTWDISGTGAPSSFIMDASPAVIPEPSAAGLWGVGIAVAAAWKFRRRK